MLYKSQLALYAKRQAITTNNRRHTVFSACRRLFVLVYLLYSMLKFLLTQTVELYSVNCRL